MRSEVGAGFVLVFSLGMAAFGVPKTEIWYSMEDLGAGRWQYAYDVASISLTVPIEEFTIWFEYGLYDNLALETASPLADNWDEIVLQPEPVLEDDGAYDAKAMGPGINMGQRLGGFAVSFDWLGDVIVRDAIGVLMLGWALPSVQPHYALTWNLDSCTILHS